MALKNDDEDPSFKSLYWISGNAPIIASYLFYFWNFPEF